MPRRKRFVGPAPVMVVERFLDQLQEIHGCISGLGNKTDGTRRFLCRNVPILNELNGILVSTKEPFSLWVSFTLPLKVSLPITQTSPSRRCLHLRVRCHEFRLWPKDEKGKVQIHYNALDVILTQPNQYFDELSGEKAHSKSGIVVHYPVCYKWSFTKSKGREDDKTASRNQDIHKSKSSSSAGPSRVFGPTLPSTADLVLAREREEEGRKAERSYKRKRDKAEDKERIEEMVDREKLIKLDS
ncbi:hypothetical protein C8J56DRAFT_1075716 [Mycena floridula]|nr:hypothetical protein C8J56DRAFT_1075716 [Mycena floridula]